MNVTLMIGNRDLSSRLSKYKVTKEVNYATVVTTMDGTERASVPMERDIISFRLWPQTGYVAALVYAALAEGVVTATYTDTATGQIKNARVRVITSLANAFALTSPDSSVYYKGEEILLRAVEVNAITE